MKIAFFSDNFYPELSGVSDSIVSLGRALIARGHEVRFCVPAYSSGNYRSGGKVLREPDLGGPYSVTRFFSIPFPTPTGQGRAVIPTGLRWLDLRSFSPDVIHTQLFFGTGIEALITAHTLRKPLVGTNHTAMKAMLDASPLMKRLGYPLLKYISWYYNRCDMVTAPSNAIVDEMRSYGFRKSATIISNPIDTDTFTPAHDKEALRKKFDLPDATIIHAGRLGAERRIDVLIEALALVLRDFPEAVLVIAGRGTEEEKLRRLSRDRNIEDHVRFLGVLDHRALAEVYNAGALFVIASTAETQSLVTMQAMASGLPVVAPNVPGLGLTEYVTPEAGFLVKPNDPAAFAERIVFLLKNEIARKSLGIAARAWAETFSSPAIAEKWELLYKEAVKMYYS